jgi:hypothetical protein
LSTILISILIRIYRSASELETDEGLANMKAIARSHRYGQSKKVLVFKLMTKDSIEGELIPNDGYGS